MFFFSEGVNLGMGISELITEETSKKKTWTIGYKNGIYGSMDDIKQLCRSKLC